MAISDPSSARVCVANWNNYNVWVPGVLSGLPLVSSEVTTFTDQPQSDPCAIMDNVGGVVAGFSVVHIVATVRAEPAGAGDVVISLGDIERAHGHATSIDGFNEVGARVVRVIDNPTRAAIAPNTFMTLIAHDFGAVQLMTVSGQVIAFA